MVIFALFCSLAWLATRTHQTAHLALAYWGYALAGFVAMMLIVVAKEWIVEIPERRQERLARQRMERIGKLRLASPDASFQAWRAVNRGRDRGHGPECAVPFPAIVAAPARDPQTALRAP